MPIAKTVKRALLVSATTIALGMGTISSVSAKTPTEKMDKDEAGIWFQMDKIEDDVKTSGLRITDPTVVNYVQSVTCKVLGDECSKVRVYVINQPVFNASMAPNGMMLIYSGLLLRTENEAQLSCVIGHEYGHFKNRHSLQQWRSAKNMANGLMVMQLAVGAAAASGGISVDAADTVSLLSSVFAMGALQSFSREHEREADLIGFHAAAEAGYASEECSKTWLALMEEQNSSSFKKVRKRSRKKNNGIFSSHPVPTERAKTLKALSKENAGGDYVGIDSHMAALLPNLAAWMDSELLAKDFDRHIYLFDRLQDQGHLPAVIDYYIGEAYRLRRTDGDREKAVEYWEKSSEQLGAPVEVWRSLGEHYRRKKKKTEALTAYNRYLQEAPNASDKALIENYIKRLSGEN